MPPWGNPAYEGDPMWNNPWQPRPLNAPLRDPGSATDPGPPPGAGPPGPWESGASGAASADAAPRDLPSSWGQVPIADGRSFSYSGESIGSSTQDPAQYVPVGRQPSGSAAPGAGAAPGAPPPPGFPEAYPPGMPIGGPPPPGSDPSQQMQWMQQQTYIRQTQGAYGSWVPGQPRPE